MNRSVRRASKETVRTIEYVSVFTIFDCCRV